jgi:hypothetical protein
MKYIAILVAAFLAATGVKLIFFNAPTAEADSLSIKSARVDVTQLHHQNAMNLPVHEFHDMSLVFPEMARLQ